MKLMEPFWIVRFYEILWKSRKKHTNSILVFQENERSFAVHENFLWLLECNVVNGQNNQNDDLIIRDWEQQQEIEIRSAQKNCYFDVKFYGLLLRCKKRSSFSLVEPSSQSYFSSTLSPFPVCSILYCDVNK